MAVNNGDSSVRVCQLVMVPPALIDESGFFQPLDEFVRCHCIFIRIMCIVVNELLLAASKKLSLSSTASIRNVGTSPLAAGGWRCPLDPVKAKPPPVSKAGVISIGGAVAICATKHTIF